MNVRLLRNGILLSKNNDPIMSSGGLLMPADTIKGCLKAEVLAVGKGIGGRPVQCQVGDTIKYNPMVSLPVTLFGKEYIYITESGLMCVL